MHTKATAIDTAYEFTRALLVQGLKLDRAIIFGSYVNGSPEPYSDIDIALVSPQFSGFGFEDRKLFARLNNRQPFINIETKTFPSEYFEQGDPFISEILRTGIEVYNSNTKTIS
ncbi:MAG TPA: nucleotidyltransferase domain-containing protein [Catalimonadaceae bacterium]|nr:nucleotidyltransferase domain-containing protein [Catalimonadaceae bacterium]HPI11546.1 nucleotidyltransferase domain-containing protein [Catalimonadaceae bacterium]